jgi:GH25 family lysozyme M1 (1,4-beta-N-acetylmuramidase)
MKLSDDKFNQKKEIKRGWTVTRMITWVILFCIIIVAFVFGLNNKDAFVGDSTEASLNAEENYVSVHEEEHNITSNDLQIWEDPVSESDSSSNDEETLNDEADEEINQEETQSNGEETVNESDPTEVPAGFFRITLDNGEYETHKINKYLTENALDYSQFTFDGKETLYNFEENQKSYIGIKVSKEQGYIDFHKVKKDGIDFVMIAAGSRGYGTGQIVLDDYAREHLRNASDANLEIGLYFKSQAITEDEAIEEANEILTLVDGYQITYPIAFEMDRVHSDEGRTESLDRINRTKITLAFLNTIAEAGYDTCVYGTPEFLIDFIDLSQLTSYDLWLDQEIREPEIPYKFTMWEFQDDEQISGVSGHVPVIISVIDYLAK